LMITLMPLLSPCFTPPIIGWRFSGELFEDAIELGERLKSDRERRFAHAKIEIFQKLTRVFEAISRDVIDKLTAGHVFKLLAQVSWINSDRVRDFRQ